MSSPELNYICKFCRKLIPTNEKIMHEMNCKLSKNLTKCFYKENSFKYNTQKYNFSKTNEKNNILNNKNFVSLNCNNIGLKFISRENEDNSLFQNNENTNKINNITIFNTINYITSKNEEALNMDGVQIAQNIQANGIRQELPEEDQNNEYYYYNHNSQDNEDDNSFWENARNDEIISFNNISINNRNNHADTKIVENLITNELKDINKFPTKECRICLQEFKNGDYYIILPCIHFFHNNCIKTWMERNNTCPICKYLLKVNNLTSKICNKKFK